MGNSKRLGICVGGGGGVGRGIEEGGRGGEGGRRGIEEVTGMLVEYL